MNIVKEILVDNSQVERSEAPELRIHLSRWDLLAPTRPELIANARDNLHCFAAQALRKLLRRLLRYSYRDEMLLPGDFDANGFVSFDFFV